MATVNIKYGAAAAITIALNGLASAASVISSAIDNTANLYLDYLVEVAVTTGTVGTNPYVAVYAVDSVDGTNFADATNAKLIGTINTAASATVYRSAAFSVADAFGGIIPPKFEIIVVNNTGAALAATGNSAQYVPVDATVV